MLPFPTDDIADEDRLLDWWENEFAQSCDSLGALLNGAALVRKLVGSIRAIRNESLESLLTLRQAARETGYSSRQVSRWIKQGKIRNYGSDTAPRVRRGDIISHKKASLPTRSPMRIMATAQDIARSVATRRSSDG